MHLVQVQEHWPMYQERALGVAVVSLSQPETLAVYRTEKNFSFPIYADPTKESYLALGLHRISFWHFLNPKIIWGYLRLIARGGKVKKMHSGEDPYQMGGDFLIDSQSRVAWVQTSSDPTNRPRVEDILQVDIA